MATAGYSETPLINKLGIKPGMKVLLINQPEDYYSLLAKNIKDQLYNMNEAPDFVHLFVKTSKDFEAQMKKLKVTCKKIPPLPFGFPGIRRVQRSQLILLKMLFAIML